MSYVKIPNEHTSFNFWYMGSQKCHFWYVGDLKILYPRSTMSTGDNHKIALMNQCTITSIAVSTIINVQDYNIQVNVPGYGF